MKKFFAIFTVGVALAFSSCNDLCRNVDCGANGTCDEADGKCLCNTGYELGTDEKCSVESRAKFIGTWSGTNPGSSNAHDITIATSAAGITKVRISNFANVDCTSGVPLVAVAEVDGSSLKSFTIDGCSAVSFTSASGTMASGNNSFTVTYKLDVDGTVLDRTVVYTKQ